MHKASDIYLESWVLSVARHRDQNFNIIGRVLGSVVGFGFYIELDSG